MRVITFNDSGIIMIVTKFENGSSRINVLRNGTMLYDRLQDTELKTDNEIDFYSKLYNGIQTQTYLS